MSSKVSHRLIFFLFLVACLNNRPGKTLGLALKRSVSTLRAFSAPLETMLKIKDLKLSSSGFCILLPSFLCFLRFYQHAQKLIKICQTRDSKFFKTFEMVSFYILSGLRKFFKYRPSFSV